MSAPNEKVRAPFPLTTYLRPSPLLSVSSIICCVLHVVVVVVVVVASAGELSLFKSPSYEMLCEQMEYTRAHKGISVVTVF